LGRGGGVNIANPSLWLFQKLEHLTMKTDLIMRDLIVLA
jgi:hypothetical protein